MSGLDLNGSTALVESIKQQLGNVRRDWRVEAAEMRAQLAEGMLELQRVTADARARLSTITDGAPGRDGKDGRDGVDGLAGAPGRDGIDGKDGAPGRAGVDGKDGAAGLPGERGEPGLPGVFEAPAVLKPGQITYRGKLVYHEGSTFCALCDTAATPPHADFQPVAFKGRDAYPGRALGLFDAKRTDYRALDVVTLNGSEWRAVKDAPGPCPGDGWMLGAKGVKGKPGERGEKGERGPPGIGLAHVELVETALIFTRTDGSALSVDLATLIG